MFEGDNGGGTGRGVSPTEIRVAALGFGATDEPAVRALFEYFNRTYEMYGRRLVPVFMAHGSTSTVPDQRAIAAEVGAAGVFASVGARASYWFPVYFQELARQGVISIIAEGYELAADRDMFDALHPYVWSLNPSAEQLWGNMASFVCTALAGRAATHAGLSLVSKERRFGVVVSGEHRQPWIRPLLDGLARCDVSPTVAEVPFGSTSSDFSGQARAALEKLKGAGVTTMICACAESRQNAMASAMLAANFTDAEWLLPSLTAATWEEVYVGGWPVQLRSHLFGLQPNPKLMPVQAEWWLNAAREVDPAIAPDGGHLMRIYDRLLILAAGIQAAGPRLSADTFGQGLQTLQFPNDQAGAEPYWLPSIGFGPGDHSFYGDYALAWWNLQATAIGPLANPANGSWCYLDRGARYVAGRFPADADSRFFNPSEPCR